MFEIGTSLREARERRRITIAQAEGATKVRGKYLRALEEEQFDQLPPGTYVKGFLRTYAEYLGLDGQLYVDEFNSRFASAEETMPPASSAPSSRPRHRVGDSNFVVVALAAIVAVTILVVVAFGFGNGQPADQSLPTTPVTPTTSSTGTVTTQPAKEKKQKAAPRVVRLTLTAETGSCWMLIRRGGPQGKQLYSGTLEQGQTLPVSGKRLWLQLGRPDVLRVKVDGHAVGRFPTTSGAMVVVGPHGVHEVGRA
jgi:cytoskeletal protein RodZ